MEPKPISKEEFDRRWEAGARKMKDLDPEMYKYLTRYERARTWIIAGAVFVIVAKILEYLYACC